MKSPVRCIVCNKAIPKRLTYLWFKKPTVAVPPLPPFTNGWAARPDGHREGTGNIISIYLDNRPTTKEEAQRYANGQIIRLKQSDGLITEAAVWDGESYHHKYFCKDRCAIAQGNASAHHGARYRWRDAE